ncbi:uncharacterized protein MELLADRAFT_124126 [Melampsora larici-populina 98AG31]|uniref:Secreted protein n=1 Tax=Melampsora larici-populina (strain 98AG31 / pathotype 3-4-7) TaxID=747676 RepID=F4R4V8_MELLP|nr:uncharacterized protein MELLADRAFT_124126 [Melampsora larici-populina 98AG31]EGG12931.1 secreted protein [Melampsora larici-populina 98AG31]
MNSFSTTLLAIVFMTSPFLTGAFNFADNFELTNLDHAHSWSAEELKDPVRKFFTSFDDDREEDLVNQMDPNAEFYHYTTKFLVEDLPILLEIQLKGHRYQTEIYKMSLSPDSTDKKAKMVVFGKVNTSLSPDSTDKKAKMAVNGNVNEIMQRESRSFKVFMDLIRNNGEIKIKRFERVRL